MKIAVRVALTAVTALVAGLSIRTQFACAADQDLPPVDATTFRGKVMCGYQGWFRCPGDAAAMGWIHWSRDGRKLTPQTLTFEMWPDVGELTPQERFAAPGFTYPGGEQAYLFSSDNAATVLRHFQWMRDYGIDGAWLQNSLLFQTAIEAVE